jgi:hypothetical protein
MQRLNLFYRGRNLRTLSIARDKIAKKKFIVKNQKTTIMFTEYFKPCKIYKCSKLN